MNRRASSPLQIHHLRGTDREHLFISHDISTVARVADTIAVMQNGKVVEYGPAGTVLRPPRHPYTELLLKSVPDMRTDWLDTLEPLGARRYGSAVTTAAN